MLYRWETPLERPEITQGFLYPTRFSLWYAFVKVQRNKPIAARIGPDDFSVRIYRKELIRYWRDLVFGSLFDGVSFDR